MKWRTAFAFTQIVSNSIMAEQPSVYSHYFTFELVDSSVTGIHKMNKNYVTVIVNYLSDN